MAEHHGDTALDERLAQLFGDLGVHSGQHLVDQFDDRHLRTEGLVEVAELEANRARADYHNALRHTVVYERFLAGHHAVAECHAGEELFARPSGDQNSLCLDRFGLRCGLTAGGTQRDRMRTGDRGAGLEQIDFVLAQEKANALGKFVGGLSAARDHAFEVRLYFTDFDTVLARGAADRFHRLGRIEQCLGRNASPIEAYSAGLVALDDGGAHLELARPDRSDVSARAGTDYRKIVA